MERILQRKGFPKATISRAVASVAVVSCSSGLGVTFVGDRPCAGAPMLIQYVWWPAGDAVEQGLPQQVQQKWQLKHTRGVGVTVTGHPDPAVIAFWV